ncbi:hypothetical protein V9T40_006925 [Parthenolecanium corni]|uniref:Uncharacterized protein n=1 Tax=Parthenolecanium corni TaxID=536013 RepID=A0AAN9TRM0_9HEMI
MVFLFSSRLLPSTPLHSTALHFTSLHFTSLHFTAPSLTPTNPPPSLSPSPSSIGTLRAYFRRFRHSFRTPRRPPFASASSPPTHHLRVRSLPSVGRSHCTTSATTSRSLLRYATLLYSTLLFDSYSPILPKTCPAASNNYRAFYSRNFGSHLASARRREASAGLPDCRPGPAQQAPRRKQSITGR